MDILFLLIARGGSKGISKKNLQIIGNKSLVAMKIIAGLKSKYCEEIIISTDDLEIAKEAEKYGAKYLFNRPKYLADDQSSVIDVITHALNLLNNDYNKSYDAVMLLEPSSPFTRPEDYNNTIEMMIKYNYDLIISVVKHKLDPKVIGVLGAKNSLDKIISKMGGNSNLNRQNMNENYTPNGCLYFFKGDHFRKHSKIYALPSKSYGYIMPEYYSVEIDEPIDLEWARFLYNNHLVKSEYWNS